MTDARQKLIIKATSMTKPVLGTHRVQAMRNRLKTYVAIASGLIDEPTPSSTSANVSEYTQPTNTFPDAVVVKEGDISPAVPSATPASSTNEQETGTPKTVSPSDTKKAFVDKITEVINYHSKENGSDTPDFILAQYLNGCLNNWNKSVKAREKYYSKDREELLDKVEASFYAVPLEYANSVRFFNIASSVDPDAVYKERQITDIFVAAMAAAASVKENKSLHPILATFEVGAAPLRPNLTVQETPSTEQSVAEDDNLMRILTDPDSMKLVQRLYVDYVSETDTSKIAQFFVAFDKLLYKFRDGKPLSREEIEELDEIQQVRVENKKKRRAKKGTPPPQVDDTEPDLDEVVEIG